MPICAKAARVSPSPVVSQPSTAPGNLPASWARGKQSKMQRWASGEVGSRLRAFAPQVFPGVPPGVWYGFMANGGENEDTALAARHARFHELGMFGTTAGPWNVPAPNTDTSAENDWNRYHADPRVRAMLGRDACMEPGCWRGDRGGIADQVAVGLVSMRDKANARSLPASIRPANPLSPWGILASSASWSAGAPRFARHLSPYAERLAQVPDVASDRFVAWGRMLADDLRAGRVPVGPGGADHDNPAHTYIRTRQKLAASSAVDPQAAAFFAWDRYPDLEALDTVLGHAALGHDVSTNIVPTTPQVQAAAMTVGSVVLPVAAVVGAIAVAGWWLRRGGSKPARRNSPRSSRSNPRRNPNKRSRSARHTT